ncbi:helix-turn-helix transcriptional regulator [Pedobacter sp. PAMC26386]|nr:helix-turn-helix transcriptional regulator [Pedobacter sp. PAMC26386]
MSSSWFYPEWPLSEYVATYILSDYSDGFVDGTTYMYPIGSAVLCFSLDQPAVVKEIGSGQIIKHLKFNFIHQFKQARFYEVIAFPARVLHVIFYPYGAYRILGIPQNCSFDEHGTSLSAILSDKIATLLNQIEDISYSNGNGVIKLVNNWLENQLIQRSKIDVSRVRHACSLIEMSKGNLSIKQLTTKVWLSKRALEYQFQEQVGLSPKFYSRIVRFNALLAEIKNCECIDWSEIVYKYHYFDQAHFIKEFKCFSSNCPSHLPKIRGIIT